MGGAGERQQLGHRGRRHLRQVGRPPAVPPHSAGPRTRTSTPCGRAGRIRPQGAARALAAQAWPRLDSRALPRVRPARYRQQPASRRSGPCRPRGAHISRAKARARQRRKEGGRPPTRRPGSAHRSRAPAGPGPLARSDAPVPPSSGRRQSSVRGGGGRAAPAPPAPWPHAAPPRLRGPAPCLPRAQSAADRGLSAQPQSRPGLGARRAREHGVRDFIFSGSYESKHVIKHEWKHSSSVAPAQRQSTFPGPPCSALGNP